MDLVLVVDRSLVYPDNPPELYEWRRRLVSELRLEIEPHTKAVIIYADVARTASFVEAVEPGPEPVYGANLQHALILARATSQDAGLPQTVIVTYSLPSAHLFGGKPFFMYPPVPETLEAVRSQARLCTEHGIRLAVLLLDHPDDASDARESFFRSLIEGTGGALISARSGDEAATVAELLGQGAAS